MGRTRPTGAQDDAEIDRGGVTEEVRHRSGARHQMVVFVAAPDDPESPSVASTGVSITNVAPDGRWTMTRCRRM